MFKSIVHPAHHSDFIENQDSNMTFLSNGNGTLILFEFGLVSEAVRCLVPTGLTTDLIPGQELFCAGRARLADQVLPNNKPPPPQ